MQLTQFYLKNFWLTTRHLFVVLALYAPVSSAGYFDDDSPWDVSLGLGVQVAPEFEGSDKYDAGILPLVEITFMERFFLSTINGLGAYAVNNDYWYLGSAVNYDPGRKEKYTSYSSGKKKHIDLLKGMGDIKGGAVFSIFGGWTPGNFSFDLETAYGTGDLKGLNVTASTSYTMQILSDLQWENTISTTFVDSKFADTFYGISEQQSRESQRGYDYYSASSGIKDVAFSSMLSYAFTNDVSFVLYGQYKRLTGPASRSPLVKAGSENQIFGMLGVMYTF